MKRVLVEMMENERGVADGESPLEPQQLEEGMSVLIAGPALTGKRQLLFDLVGGGTDRTTILVSSKRASDRFQRSFLETRTHPDQWETRLVDCVGKSHATDSVRDSATRKNITSPNDLTGIGIAVSGFMREFHHKNHTPRIGLHTLSTLLMYADLRRVFQFTHVLTGRISSSGFSGVFTLDTTQRNTEAMDILLGLFDGIVEVRDTDAGPELRVRGAEFGPRSWTTF